MAETKTQRKTVAKAKAPQRQRSTAAGRSRAAVRPTARFSEDVVKSVETGQRAAIDAVRTFVDTVDRSVPALPHGEGPTRRKEIVDSAMEMADRLVQTQYEFIRNVIDSAARTLDGSGTKK
ncbi:MAG: hypothetical protein ACLQBB_14640 [Solirubrobacteraceae bacterium]